MDNCNIIKDLLPLYAEGMVCSDSKELIEEHLANCEECRAELESLKTDIKPEEPAGEDKAIKSTLKKIKSRMEITAAMVIIFGSFLGVGLMNHSSSIFYNIVIMPIVGALGYVIMKWRALYNIPIILILSTVMETILRSESIFSVKYFGMLCYYIPAAFVGIIIAALYAFAFKKEDKR